MNSTKSKDRRRERGVSLPEVTVTLFLMSIVGLFFYQLYIGTIKTTMFLESNNDLSSFGQQALNEVKFETMQSRMLFQNDTRGNGYLNALNIPSQRALLTNSRLPTIDATGEIDVDTTGEVWTGNCLLQARYLEALEANVDHDGDSSTANIDFWADRYRFQFYYLSQTTERQVTPLNYAIDLMEFRSDVYADFFQLSGLDSTFRAEVGKALYADGVRFAWDPGDPAGSAFYSLASDGTMSAVANHQINPDEVQSVLPQLRGGRVSGTMSYSVGIQKDPPLSHKDPVSVYAVANGLFPSGFEVKIIGPTGARKIWARLMLVAQYQNKIQSNVNTVTITTAEF